MIEILKYISSIDEGIEFFQRFQLSGLSVICSITIKYKLQAKCYWSISKTIPFTHFMIFNVYYLSTKEWYLSPVNIQSMLWEPSSVSTRNYPLKTNSVAPLHEDDFLIRFWNGLSCFISDFQASILTSSESPKWLWELSSNSWKK